MTDDERYTTLAIAIQLETGYTAMTYNRGSNATYPSERWVAYLDDPTEQNPSATGYGRSRLAALQQAHHNLIHGHF